MATEAQSLLRHDSLRVTRRLYKNPPVVEALIDIQVESAAKVDPAELARVHAGEEERYPLRETMMTSSAAVDLATGTQIRASQELIGYRLVSSGRNKMVQLRTNGFTVNRLPPYERWEEMRDEAKRLWPKYAKAVRSGTVKRIAVRYINRIDLPGPKGDMTQYFRVYPELPAELPHQVTGFVMRLEIPQTHPPGATLVLSQGRVESPRPEVVSILLDLDLFLQVNLPLDSDELWPVMERLHERENDLFEGFITPSTQEIFGYASNG